MKRVARFVAGTLAFWLLTALPFRFLGDAETGTAALVYSGTALALCLVPTVVTLAWGTWAFDGSPDQQLLMVLGGTGVRMFVVLAGGLALTSWVPYYQEHAGFWAWVLVFYLVTLALEMVVLLAGRERATN